MIIEDLIRTGRALLENLSDEETLRLISDVTETQVKNFFQHVFVVEIPPDDSGLEPVALPMQRWGQDIVPSGKKRAEFVPEWQRALGAPFVYPKGGNPTNPQGMYGNPVFIAFEKQLRDFRESQQALRDFVVRRLDRCPSIQLTPVQLQQAMASLQSRFATDLPDDAGKRLGLVILADVGSDESAYSWGDYSGEAIGKSVLRSDRYLIPNLRIVLRRFWHSKLEEGAEEGRRSGHCTICGNGEGVISSYCKAWPWYLPEWRGPLPLGGQRKLLVEGIGLDEPCYRALTVGACHFNKLTRRIHHDVTRELFTPANDGQARQMARRRKLSDFPSIYGAAYLVPLLDEGRPQGADSSLMGLTVDNSTSGGQLVRHLDDITGFEIRLPEEATDRFRLTLVYFSGEPSRGDVHLRGVIEDVQPSGLRRLVRQRRPLADAARALLRALYPKSSEKQSTFFLRRTSLLPYMLARGYGGPYLWQQLERTLRHRPLDYRRPVRNAGHRMSTLLSGLPDSEFQLREEAFFFLTLLDFISRHNQGLAEGGEIKEPMRHWKELLCAVLESPPEEMELASPAELGFACGVLVRQFSRQYWLATKTGNEGKDYLKHRVVTFGSSLTPDVLWKRGLPQIFELETRLQDLHLSEAFRQRLGVVLNQFERRRDQVHAERDGFMAGFWSGYALQGAGRASASEPNPSLTLEESA